MNKDLVLYRLQRAKETFEDAKILFAKNRLNSTVNRLYYSLFYAVLALLETKNLASSKHSGVRSLFNQHFVKTKIVTKELGRFYAELFHLRQEADYIDYSEFTTEEVVDKLNKCKIYLEDIENIVNVILESN